MDGWMGEVDMMLILDSVRAKNFASGSLLSSVNHLSLNSSASALLPAIWDISPPQRGLVQNPKGNHMGKPVHIGLPREKIIMIIIT